MRIALVPSLVLWWFAQVSVAAPACHGVYHVRGSVTDSSGRPIAGASVRLLLDRFDEKKYRKYGPRAVRTRTDAQGRFAQTVECGSAEPGPCAPKPRQVTIMVEASGERAAVHVHKLKALDVTARGTGCGVRVPEVVLRPDR